MMRFNCEFEHRDTGEHKTVPVAEDSTAGMAVIGRKPVHVHDLLSAEGDRFPQAQELARMHGERTILSVPLLRENESVGTIIIRRREVQPFSDKQIALLQTFADQAVIAIENARLFNEVQARTRKLSQSLDDLRAAQDRLVQTEKLASLGQLTAGIAHEIKNPLNFVNNFSALSAELTDELNDTLKTATLNEKLQEEVSELTKLLKENLEKVVQHGKRADSIVKNMLLHSREGSGEHRPAEINSLLDESLNLAYHGARAEKGEFNITLQRDFDLDAGTIELFPQEIARAFLNLISKGVYAATKRKLEGKEPGFEPTLRATTKNLGSTVEIRFRDNGIGIPAEVQEKIFNPFFTTKPAGEGTGLGLSMTHDIIVKQHGGRIDVATEPGQFTEFTIVLPRKTNLSGTERGKPWAFWFLWSMTSPTSRHCSASNFGTTCVSNGSSWTLPFQRRDALTRIAGPIEQTLILILSDINMPGMTGLEMLPKVREMRPDVPIIMITAYGDPETKRKAMEGGAIGVADQAHRLHLTS
jgi:two-component system, NtrC family, sensor kinase